jgi:hypothetical protein
MPLVLVAVIAGGVLLVGCAVSAPPAPKPTETPKTAGDANPAAPDPEPPKPAVAEPPAAKESEPAKPAPDVKPAKPAPDVKADAAPKGSDDRRIYLETIGTLTASHCYQTYLNIGLIADGKSKGNYSEKDAYKVLDSVLSLLDTVDRKLGQLAKLDLEKEDRTSLEQMRKLSALLRQQGKVLQTYWESGRDDDAAKYEDVRKDSWAVIGKLLGIGG